MHTQHKQWTEPLSLSALAPENAAELKEIFQQYNDNTLKLREAYERLEKRFQSIDPYNIYSSITDALITLDLEDNILTLNKTAERVFEISEKDALGKNFEEAIPACEDGFHHYKQNPQSQSYHELHFEQQNGDAVYLRGRFSPLLDRNGDMIGTTCLFQDLSVERLLEEKARRSDRLAALGELAAGVAHEMRNPLTTVRGYIQILPDNLDDAEFIDEFSSNLIREIDRLTRLTENLLNMAKPISPELQPCSLYEMIQEILDFQSDQLSKHQVEVDIQAPTCRDTVCIDKDRIKQVFINLIRNSAEAMDGGGTIVIELQQRTETLSENKPQEYVVAVLKDNGPGIPENIIDRLFDPFFTTKDHGTGLGLALSNRIVEEHQGFLRVDRQSKDGAMTARKLLLVDDETGIRNLLNRVLSKEGYDLREAENGDEAIALAKEDEPDLVLCDIKMPGKDGIQVLEELKQISPEIEVIMLTAYSTVESAVQAMKLGAVDYIKKPFDVDELKVIIRKNLGLVELKRENSVLREEAGLKYGMDRIIGNSPEMKRIFEEIKTIAPTPSTVLINGESGTGKELIAGAIHYLSPRRNKRFIKVNCAAISEELLESELFGHEKGAFTGAVRANEGKFVLADGGTILLDEISEMSPKLQAKLLRVLQEKEVDKVGGREPVKVDVRVTATTNRDLKKEISNGGFREDLYYRLNVVAVSFPPLRDRKSDIPELVKHFLDKYIHDMNKKISGISKEAEEVLIRYNWPGNVRQLENSIERAVVLCLEDIIQSHNLPPDIVQEVQGGTQVSRNSVQVGMTVAEMEKQLIMETLKHTDNNRTRAADILGISIRTLRNKLNEYKKPGEAAEND
jgi:PAS domain S-box-containing protein